MTRLKVGVLISGRGSNLKALIEAATDPTWPAEIALVISNVPKAPGLDHAVEAGIKAVTVDHRQFPNRETFEDTIHSQLIASQVKLVQKFSPSPLFSS